MKGGTVIVAVLVAYIGFEAYAIKRAGHRTEPDDIHALLIRASEAATQCGNVDAGLQNRFDRTLARNLDRYRDELAEELADRGSREQGGPMIATIDAVVRKTTEAAMADVRTALAEGGCDAQAIRDHLRRYEIYARKSR